MQFIDPTKGITIEQLKEAPLNRWCASGHVAPENFRRGGPDDVPSPTFFFRVRGQGIDGTYCEPCLVVANHLAKLKKEGKI